MRRSLSVAGGLILAVVLSQFPEYAQQYQQRLGGAVDELHVITADFDNAATGAGLTRDEALARYAHAPDAFIAGRGTNMAATFARYAQLSAALARMREFRNSLVPTGDRLFTRRYFQTWLPVPRLDKECWNKKDELKAECAVGLR